MHDKQVVHLLHLPKTGGRALKVALRPFSKNLDYYLVLKPGHYSLASIPLDDKFFFTLRDPLSRFVSGFNHIYRQGAPLFREPWTPFQQRVFEVYDSANQLAEALARKEVLAVEAMSRLGHLRKIALQMGGLDNLRKREANILMVCFQERLTEDFVKLKNLLELPEECALPNNPVQANMAPQCSLETLSEHAKVCLVEHYQEDYELIEYCKSLNF